MRFAASNSALAEALVLCLALLTEPGTAQWRHRKPRCGTVLGWHCTNAVYCRDHAAQLTVAVFHSFGCDTVQCFFLNHLGTGGVVFGVQQMQKT